MKAHGVTAGRGNDPARNSVCPALAYPLSSRNDPLGQPRDMTGDPAKTEAFIARWQGQEGGQERANYALFLSELCDVLGVPRPAPAAATTEENDYVFERVVKRPSATARTAWAASTCTNAIALSWKPNSHAKAADRSNSPSSICPAWNRRPAACATPAAAWDVLMLNARRQAEDYARALPTTTAGRPSSWSATSAM